MEKDFINILTRHGWSDHAAQAALDLGGSHPWGENADAPWPNQRMRDWVSASLYKPPTDQASQLAYLAYDQPGRLLMKICLGYNRRVSVKRARRNGGCHDSIAAVSLPSLQTEANDCEGSRAASQ